MKRILFCGLTMVALMGAARGGSDDVLPLPHEVWVCTARSLLGRAFTGQGPTEEQARAAALAACEEHAFSCYITRCGK